MGIVTKSQLVKLNVDLDLLIVVEVKYLFREYKDVFAWSYKDLIRIPIHIAQHWIELDTMIPPSHQNWYWMNLNYVVVDKHDLDKLLTT
jgi:hypothetical protein